MIIIGTYQTYRGNPENKLFYLLEGLVGGLNTEFSDDASADTDFSTLVNFDTDKLGTLIKRNGFGKLSGLSAIFNNFNLGPQGLLPYVHNRKDDDQSPEDYNDNIVYMKLLRNDNNCFQNLSAFEGYFGYRDYQKMYGFQNNEFHLLMITVKEGVTTSWLYKCKLPQLGEDENVETLTITCDKKELPVTMTYNKNLMNMETIEFYDKIYFTCNNKGLICFDRTTEEYTYSGFSDEEKGVENSAYKPNAIEIARVGFNVLGDDPMRYINYKNISTDSIQSVYITTTEEVPVLAIPTGPKFLLNILYTGQDKGFTITLSEGGNNLSHTAEEKPELSGNGLKCYEITFTSSPTNEVEIKIEKNEATIEAFYDYYTIAPVSAEATKVEPLNVGECGMVEMYHRAVYYKKDIIWFSDIDNFSYIPNYNFVTLPIEPTDEITKICYFKNIYVVFTKESIYKIVGEFGSSNFTIQPVNMSLGCHAGHTVVPIENMLYFASPRGLYALKSSEFREGFENLVELDMKVKKLTSDFTFYSYALSEDNTPVDVTRYGGISENAYALRYKDKYLLFYNTAYDKIDYAAENNLDVLAYNFDMKSFSTYSFQEKPTFLFTVGGNVLTYCATLQEGKVTLDPDVMIDYDLTTQEADDIIVDNSGKGNDGVVKGDTIVNQNSYALGDFDYLEATLTDQYETLEQSTKEFMKNLDVHMDLKLEDNQKDKTIFDMVGKGLGGDILPYTGELVSEVVDGYQAILNYTVIHVPTTGGTVVYDDTSVQCVLSLVRTSTDVLPNVTGKINIKGLFNGEENYFNHFVTEDGITGVFGPFQDVEFTADFADSLRVEILADTLTRNIGEVTETQTRGLKLNLDITTHDSYSYYEKGANVSGKSYKVVNELNWIYLGIPYSVVAYDGYARFTVTNPYAYHKYRLNIQTARALTIQVAGKSMSFSIPKMVADSGTSTASGSKYVDIPYPENVLNGTGVYTVTVSNTFNIRATLGGVRRENLTNSFSVTLPKIQLMEGDNTTEVAIESSTEYNLIYTEPDNDLYFRLKLNPSDSPEELLDKNILYCEISDNQSGYGVYCVPIEDINERHTYGLKRINNIIEITCDGNFIGELDLPDNYFANRNWKSVLFGTDQEKTNYLNWEFFSIDFGVFRYTSINNESIDDTTLKLIDKSGNDNNGVMYGYDVVEYDGVYFSGIDSYIQLPEFQFGFYKGFDIDMNILLKPNEKTYKIFDFATSYGNANKPNKNCSVNLSVTDGILTFNATNNELKSLSMQTKNSLSYNTIHNIKIKCREIEENEYTIDMYVDSEEPVVSKKVNFNPFDRLVRYSNFIGKSNDETDGYLNGSLYSFKITIPERSTEFYDYGNIYEFGTATSDFNKPIYYELTTKGLNLKYPQHLKKLKHIFIKARGGYKPNDMVFELYNDGYLMNDPNKYYCYVDETGKVVYDYTVENNLTIDERLSLLNNMKLDETRLGEGEYQTKKLVIPAKGKNFKMKLYGKNKDHISLESFGFVSKLGKVKQD